MQESSSKECLNNAERLLKDANLLFENGSNGSAVSLSITALEEIGKAIILELTSLNYIDREIASRAMRQHYPKKIVLKAIQLGIILHDQINRDRGDYSINLEKLQELHNILKSEINTWEERRTLGLYVQVNVENDSIVSSPTEIANHEAKKTVNEAEDLLMMGKVLCKILPEFQRGKSIVNNMRIHLSGHDVSNQSSDGDVTISYDEI